MNAFLSRCLILALFAMIFSHPVFGQWNRIFNFQNQMMGISFINRDTGFVCGGYQGAALLRTTTGGYTWEDYTGSFTAPIMSVCFLTPMNGFIYYRPDFNPGIYATTDGGVTWTMRYWWSPYIRTFCFPTPVIGYAISGAMEYVDVLKTTDGGINWTRVASITTVLPGLGVTQAVFLDENLGYFTTEEGSVYKTTNGGFNWSRVYHSHYFSMNGIAFTDSMKGFVAAAKKDWTSTGDGMLLRTFDGGLHWDSTFFDPGCSAVSFTTADTGYLGMDAVYKTVDGGSTWDRDTCNYWAGVTRFAFPTHDIGYAIGSMLIYKHDPDVGVSVPESTVREGALLYPMPVRDEVTIVLNRPGATTCTLEIVDLHGVVVRSYPAANFGPDGRSVTLSTAGLQPGAYLCRIGVANGRITRKFFIIR